jgi:SAM-dependent methyltransferase
MNELKRYTEYLLKRSFVGSIYRRYYLYPKINRLIYGSLLDVGCGIGDMLRFRENSIGVDVNPYNVEVCKANNLDAQLMMVDALPFADCSFDSVLLDNVLEHINSPIPLIKEIKRVLKPKATLIVGVPGIKGYGLDDDHKIFYDEDKLLHLAKNNGLTVASFTYTPLFKSTFLSRTVKQYCIYVKLTNNN